VVITESARRGKGKAGLSSLGAPLEKKMVNPMTQCTQCRTEKVERYSSYLWVGGEKNVRDLKSRGKVGPVIPILVTRGGAWRAQKLPGESGIPRRSGGKLEPGTY